MLEPRPNSSAVKSLEAFHALDCLRHVVHEQTRNPFVDDLGSGTPSKRNHRRAARHRFDHDKPERLRPIDREQKRGRIPEKGLFLALVDLADELDVGMFGDHWLDDRFPIISIRLVDLGGHLQSRSRARGDLDRAVRPLFRRNPPQIGKVASRWTRIEAEKISRKAVVNRAHPICVRQAAALILGNRYQRRVGEYGMDEPLLLLIQTPVHRRHRAIHEVANDGEVKHVDMKVQDVELLGLSSNALEHHDLIRGRIMDA